VLAIADELTEHGFVLRYRTGETDDGMSGKEGTVLICSFWLVSALAIIGEEQQARDLMERLLRVASPLGLFAEEFDVDTGRHLGNFPQAFSHLALIEAAARIMSLSGSVSSRERHGYVPWSARAADLPAVSRDGATERVPLGSTYAIRPSS
jgi:glycogen debranching enzyme